MHRVPRLLLAASVAIAGVSLIAVTPVTPRTIDVQARAVRLISGDTADSPLGDGTALIVGPSVLSTPSQTYADFADTLYLEPRGFTGTTEILTTPEGPLPLQRSLHRGVRPVGGPGTTDRRRRDLEPNRRRTGRFREPCRR
jgi:hypothetical protein